MRVPAGGVGGVVPELVRELLREERTVLGRLRERLVGDGGTAEDVEQLRQAELDLDELFLLVVVGEFNSGKSAFINALLGARVLREGVTPTTAVITRLRYASAPTERREGALLEVGYPLDLLRDVAVVDTPGTNAIVREHEEITSHFVPRADLVLFVTSADRPFTETERAFMERIRTWGKKVVVVLNKVDLLDPAQVAEQMEFVRRGVERLLGFRPEVFPVSARLAVSSKLGADGGADWQASRFQALEDYVTTTLDETGRLRLKLSTPLGIAERIARTYAMAAEEKLALLAGDLALVESIDVQLGVYRDDMQRDFAYRLGEVDNILHEMSARGVEYLDTTLRFGRIVDLFRQRVLKQEFERIVVADTPERIDRLTQELIDWMVDQDVRVWRTVTEQVESRRRLGTAGPAERLAGSFEYDRRALLGTLGQTARGVLQRHDHQREATQLAASVRESITQATLLEAGAVGLGAVSMAILGSAAADVSGLFAASVLAGVGLWLLPRKRRQAKAQFRSGTEELRARLVTALRDEFQRELERSAQRIRDAVAPYHRFVHAERDRTQHFNDALQAALAELARLRSRIMAV
ncbi:MAG TPA: dynamin family protein [Chloroflexota bacterium]|nr:dynamin family protein [Chloroflexota bacterium]